MFDYEHIMVPLDGSELAESVLPHVKAVAGGCNVKKITLVRVIEPFGLNGMYSGLESGLNVEERQRLEQDSLKLAEQYLSKVAQWLKKQGIDADIKVPFGRKIDEIVKFSENEDVDLIILATHGRSGVSRLVWGSVTDKIIRSVCVPVFLVRSPGCGLLAGKK